MIASALAGDGEDVAMGRLTETLVRPDDDSVVAVEVAERVPPGLTGAVEPLQLAAPDEGIAATRVACDARMTAELGPVCGRKVGGVPVGGDLHRSGVPWAGRQTAV